MVIKSNIDSAIHKLDKQLDAIDNPEKALDIAAETTLEYANDAFREETSPSGKAWEVTKETEIRKAKKGKTKININTGLTVNNLSKLKTGKKSAQVKADTDYASYANDKNAFLEITPEMEDEIKEKIENEYKRKI